jgi:hypothetical protein
LAVLALSLGIVAVGLLLLIPSIVTLTTRQVSIPYSLGKLTLQTAPAALRVTLGAVGIALIALGIWRLLHPRLGGS